MLSLTFFPVVPPLNRDLWDADPEDEDQTESLKKIELSLNDCLLAVSPFGDILVLANLNNVAVYHHNKEGSAYHVGHFINSCFSNN